MSIDSGIVDKPVNVTFELSNDGIVQLEPNAFVFSPNSVDIANFTIFGRSAGHLEITASATPEDAIEYVFKFETNIYNE